MNMLRSRKSSDAQAQKQQENDPRQLPEPQTAAEYLRRGYAFYARHNFTQAIQDYQAAIAKEPELLDAVYALGMTYKAEKDNEKSILTFQKVLDMLNAGAVGDRVRADMLRRLAMGHINEIASGDWNLEKEIWQRVE